MSCTYDVHVGIEVYGGRTCGSTVEGSSMNFMPNSPSLPHTEAKIEIPTTVRGAGQ